MVSNVQLYRPPQGYTAMMAAYDVALEHWSVSYECMIIPTRHGATHLVASGECESPPLVLLGGSGANATRWLPNIADLSRKFRVFTLERVRLTFTHYRSNRSPRDSTA